MDKNLLNFYLNKISSCAKLLSERGWAEAGSGNISLLIDANQLENIHYKHILKNIGTDTFETEINLDKLANFGMFITNSGSRMRNLDKFPEESISLLKFFKNNQFISIIGNKNITSEWESHLGLYNEFLIKNIKRKAVIHIHPPDIIAFTHILKDEKRINSILKEMLHEMNIFLPDGVGFIKHHNTGSKELAMATIEKLGEFKITLWEKHGIISSGNSLDEALDYIEIINQAVKIFFKVYSIPLNLL